ncbi:putative circularly permuted ATP-grasp superfamily protein [Methylobacterium fujisawaense]|uniref:Circularly permuted ATP-grasp superfamily protein n=1 Tax=Methylobacterium fujisawaense TaxID=107400 RepID=A0ABR6DA30_9HYPH|nr:circularly permuted type 2 ATP-grasp protein [Methylobacterium fujisawaense]MBA9062930.1 putative circularly permuted ATP-grasp superfamily protein [Methylobacterium fujisawaense]
MAVTAFDEMNGIGASDPAAVRDAYGQLKAWLESTPPEHFNTRRSQAELLFRRIGITFAVYGDNESTERLIPFDIIPRVITKPEWAFLERGLKQRVTAINLFLKDIYGAQECIKAGIIPADLVYRNAHYRMEMRSFRVPHDLYVHIAGIDIVRTSENDFFVLEDNARIPSGVSYMLENREVMLRLFPDLFSKHRVAPVENYPDSLLATLRSLAPGSTTRDPTVVLLTPGRYNSAFYEHSFLADKLGVELVEASDLFTKDDVVYMRTTEGPRKVDVIYRRLDDDFLDPLVFRPDSVLGVPGLMNAYERGSVTLANAVGTGISDDKAVYSYMPEIVKFFTGEEPILHNVPTYRCREKDAFAYVMDNLSELVVKEVNGSGGYGMLVGPHASKRELDDFARKLKHAPDGFIAQPTLSLSTCPTFVASGVAPRHVDLRPFVLCGADKIRIVPGGLTRVALKEGSLVVNSSQGGGTKDTWVLDA